MEVILIKAFQLILSLSILVALHELGHFIPARLFGTRVEKFYLFFDWPFSLFKKKIGDTEYGIGVLPLGGYVKISGMVDESFDTENLKNEPQDWEFRSKPAWQRLIIMLGGVFVNFILGFLIYMMILSVWGKDVVTKDNLTYGFKVSETMQEIGFKNGDKILTVDGNILEDQWDINTMLLTGGLEKVEVIGADEFTRIIDIPETIGLELIKNPVPSFLPYPDIIIDSIFEGSSAASSGLLKGDVLLKANGVKTLSFQEFDTAKKINVDYIDLELKRGDEIVNRVVPFDNEEKIIGINLSSANSVNTTNLTYSFAESIPAGYNYGLKTLSDYVISMKYVFTKEGASQLGGFGTIGKIFPAKWNWKAFWKTTAFLSIILAFMNLLPIPALDGGHVMFLLYEMVSGKKPSDKFLEYATLTGFILLISLFVYANGMDIIRAFS
ncbi:MAG: RIP metalloprotease RseP [Bacteroidota bacterium]|nr:RIP metalloprotease RseP [Bacteroidota bacterium]MEE2605056.1 RIP metalloprotease RseP [Bacteroidota bacterium]